MTDNRLTKKTAPLAKAILDPKAQFQIRNLNPKTNYGFAFSNPTGKSFFSGNPGVFEQGNAESLFPKITKKFYDKTCVDVKANNCWGILIER